MRSVVNILVGAFPQKLLDLLGMILPGGDCFWCRLSFARVAYCRILVSCFHHKRIALSPYVCIPPAFRSNCLFVDCCFSAFVFHRFWVVAFFLHSGNVVAR